ncbi:MAG: ABC transporter permease [Halioglobus sp.]|nr:ABC transporter permease [Halioglobus sp.]
MTNPAIGDLAQTQPGTSLWQDAWLRLRRNRLALVGLIILLLFIFIAAVTPWIAPYGYAQQDLELGAAPPSAAHWLGTDIFGRDLLTQIMFGGRISLAVGFVATAVALLIGITWGAIAGYMGGRVDAVMMRLVDIIYALPFMIFIILLMVVFGRNMLLLFLAIGAVEWLTMARIMRSQVQSLRQQEFVEAAVSLGLPTATIIRRHLIPNALGPIIVYTTLTVPSVMLLEAFLSFLGLGVQPPETSWGLLISYGAESMEEYPWLLLFPGLALTLTLFSLNFLGDGLRDALDVRGAKD